MTTAAGWDGAKRRAIALLALCEVLGMSLWFAASAIAPQLRAIYHLTGLHEAAFASAALASASAAAPPPV